MKRASFAGVAVALSELNAVAVAKVGTVAAGTHLQCCKRKMML
jgi:hypothetical protein